MIDSEETPTREESIPKNNNDVLDLEEDLQELTKRVDKQEDDIKVLTVLKSSVDSLSDKFDDLEEDIELLDKARRDSSESKRNIRDNAIILLIGGIITTLFTFLGHFFN